MKKHMLILATLLCFFTASLAFSIPPTEDYCIEPDEGVSATAYCNNVSTEPTEVQLYCETTIGFHGQQKGCIGNLLSPKPY